MDVLVWVTEGTWPACVRAARELVAPDARLVLLHVVDDEVGGAASGAFAGLLGRSGGPARDPGRRVRELADQAGRELLAAAAAQVGRQVATELRHGRVEREVVAAIGDSGAGLLVLARDGDLRRIGPHSLSPPTRFVVDHAPCATLLVWPEGAPRSDALPPPPKLGGPPLPSPHGHPGPPGLGPGGPPPPHA